MFKHTECHHLGIRNGSAFLKPSHVPNRYINKIYCNPVFFF